MNTTASKRGYRVSTVNEAKAIARQFVEACELENAVLFGLPEIDDRYDIWRVPLLSRLKERVGEVVIDAVTTFIDEKKTTTQTALENRLLGRQTGNGGAGAASAPTGKEKKRRAQGPKISYLRNTIGLGDSEELLADMPAGSVDLIFTSPPYYNARPEYADYITYEEYLLKIRKILHLSHHVLNEGRFFVMNVSPVLIRRASRSEASKRIAVPFDMHRLFIEEGFEFIDDIHWVKPEGAGWATGRGRRFAADRNPLQYKPVPVTEYVLVYRKQTDKLIDWWIRKHPNPELVRESKIDDGYEVTNLWKIHPAHSKLHPAIFPEELAAKVIAYYSFKRDVVMDPFGGVGTVAKAALKHDRRFVHFEQNPEYMTPFLDDLASWAATEGNDVNCINCAFPPNNNLFS